jgi:hypothetical protein
LHAMVFAADLAQYINYTGDAGVTKPRAETALAFGGQLAWLPHLGDPSNALAIGVDLRYAPGVFRDASTGESGAVQFSFGVAYYVSLYDFN